MALVNFRGKLNMLRVHEVGTGFGPSSDKLDVEVVFALASHKGKSFGFRLRDDKNEAAHRGMLALLQSAFDHNWTVNADANIGASKKNGTCLRVWLTK